jgi:outer membrane immunogenic protein
MNVSEGATTVFDGHVWSSNFGPLWGTLRGRAGYLFSNDLLAYATAGLAVASIDDTSIGNTPGETAAEDGLRAGLVAGVGVEYAMDERWTLKAEFLHMDFGKESGQSSNAENYSFD